MARTRIGISGFRYDGWKGSFFPGDLPRARWLSFVASRFNTVEINGSFYSLLRPNTYEAWHQDTPKGFLFAVKGGRYLTHNKRLKEVQTPLANFFASGLLRLEDKLGPILWQLPKQRYDPERVRAFLDQLPRDTESASRLASRHDHRLDGRSSYAVDRNRRLRHALEVRHPSLFTEELVRAARETGVALVVSHSGDWDLVEEVTAGFLYLRLHGGPHTYASGYGPKALQRWADRIRTWSEGGQPEDAARITDRAPPRRKSRDIYVYFDNDQKVYAPRDAERLMKLLGVQPP